MNFGNQIKNRRNELNLTLKEVSIYVGVAEATVQRWESGNIKTIKGDKLNKLANILQVSVEELTYWIDGKEPTQKDFARWDEESNIQKIQEEVVACELFEKCYGKDVFEVVSMFLKLDSTDWIVVKGAIEALLKQEKYSVKEE